MLERRGALDAGILPREARDEPGGVVLLVELVEEPAAELERLERVPERVDDAPLPHRLLDPNDLLGSEGINLGVAAVAELVPGDEIFAEGAARSFAEDGHLRDQIQPWLVVPLRRPVLAEPLVPGPHAGDA